MKCAYCRRKGHKAKHCLQNPNATRFIPDIAASEAKKLTGHSKIFTPQINTKEFEPESGDEENDDIYYHHIDGLIRLDRSFLETFDFYNSEEYDDDENQSNDSQSEQDEPNTMFTISRPSFEELVKDGCSTQSLEYYIEFLEHKHSVTTDPETGKFRIKQHTIISTMVKNVPGAALIIDTGSETNLTCTDYVRRAEIEIPQKPPSFAKGLGGRKTKIQPTLTFQFVWKNKNTL